MKKYGLILFLFLTACGGEVLENANGGEGMTSSSSSSSSSSSGGTVPSSLNIDYGGDVPRGRTLWVQKKCDTCHGNGPLQGDVWPLDTHKLIHTTLENLADYIEKEMPRVHGPEICVGQCALDTAQVMIDWVNNPADYIPKHEVTIETAQCNDNAVIDPPGLVRLSNVEYLRTLRDLFLLESLPDGSALPDDEIVSTFTYSDSITDSHAEAYQLIGESVAKIAVDRTNEYAGCSVDGDDSASLSCAKQYLNALTKRAFRGPVDQGIVDVIISTFEKSAQSSSVKNSLQVAISSVLQSPFFIYRPRGPIGLDSNASHLDQFINASRLSYLLAGTLPDRPLWRDANAGSLTQAKLLEHAERLVTQDDTLNYLSQEFVGRWLQVNRTAGHRDDLTEETREALRDAAIAFIRGTAWGANGGLKPLLTAKLRGEPDGRVVDDPTMVGAITQPGWMTNFASDRRTRPIVRGVYVAEQLLCREVPGFDGVVEFPEPVRGVSLRERLEKHREDPLCSSCHALFDPFGLALENYDLNGQWRDTDDGAMVESFGEFKTNDGLFTFDGPETLFAGIANSDEIKRCVSKQWFAYAHRIARPKALNCRNNVVVDSLSAGGLENMILSTLENTNFFEAGQ